MSWTIHSNNLEHLLFDTTSIHPTNDLMSWMIHPKNLEHLLFNTTSIPILMKLISLLPLTTKLLIFLEFSVSRKLIGFYMFASDFFWVSFCYIAQSNSLSKILLLEIFKYHYQGDSRIELHNSVAAAP